MPTTTEKNQEESSSSADLQFDVVLKPFGKANHDVLDAIEVQVRASRIDTVAGESCFRVPLFCASIQSCDLPADSIVAFDESGALQVSAIDEEPDKSGFLYHRLYSFDRATCGVVTLRYVASANEKAAGARPPFDLLYSDGAISGAGVSFLLTPVEDSNRWRMRLEWDRGLMPENTSVVSSWGEGVQENVGSVRDIQFAFYMAGNLQSVVSDQPHALALNAYWFGTPQFDIAGVMPWVGKLYAKMAAMLPVAADRPFNVLARPAVIETSGGAALQNSFMIGYGTRTERDARIKFLLAHEMAHPLAGNVGADAGLHQWYGEGLAEFYKLMAPQRTGMVTDEDFLYEFSRSSRGYFGSRYINLPNDQIRPKFWSDSQAQDLPYSRGLMYFLGLNVRVLQASNGARNLDHLVSRMQNVEQSGRQLSLEDWRNVVSGELGADELNIIDGLIAGETIVPPDNIFGDRFVRRATRIPVIDTGFDEVSFRTGKVTGIQTDSNAYESGLRDGDSIESHDYDFRGLAYQFRKLTVKASRGDAPSFEVSFAPVREYRDGYEWCLRTSDESLR